MKFQNLIKDKTVALVGPAAYMMGSSYGEEINSCDIVIRINRSYESVKEHSKDIGNRTDVLYSCLIEKPANAGKLDLDIFLENNIKYICAPPESNMKGLSNETKLHDLINKEKVYQISNKIPVRIVDHIFHNDLSLSVDCRPNTGFVAIYDLLRYSPKQLNVYGFSFYLDGFFEGVKEGVQEEQGLTPQEFADKCFGSKRHVQKNMWKHAKQTLLSDPIVKLDSTLQKILEMKEFSREEFKGS